MKEEKEMKEMSNQEILFGGTFKTTKVGDGRDAKYKLSLITPAAKEGEKETEKEIGTYDGLMKAKFGAGEYVAKNDKKATAFKMIHHKPGREKDAREKLTVKSMMKAAQ